MLGSSTNESLEQNNSQLFLICFLIFFEVLSTDNLPVLRSLGSDLNLGKQVILIVLVVLDHLLLNCCVNSELCLLKGDNVGMLLASEAFFEVKLDLVHTHSVFKDFVRKSPAQLLETLIGSKSLRLNLVLIGLFVERESVSGYGSIHS